MDTTNSEFVYLPAQKLRLHPQNLRRIYKQEGLLHLAANIKRNGGVYQALLVMPVPDDVDGNYFVVDGNRRLKAGHILGKECPLLKCEIISADQAEQKLIMLATAIHHEDPDPVSKALHMKSLMDNEHMSICQVAGCLSVGLETVKSYLRILELEEEIQDLIAHGELPRNINAVNALLQINGSETRIDLARRLASNGSSIKTIIRECDKYCKKHNPNDVPEDRAHPIRARLADVDFNEWAPAVPVPARHSSSITKHSSSPVRTAQNSPAAVASSETNKYPPGLQWKGAEPSFRLDGDDISLSPDLPIPMWGAVIVAARNTCKTCNLRDMANLSLCKECPGVDLLRRLALNFGSRNDGRSG